MSFKLKKKAQNFVKLQEKTRSGVKTRAGKTMNSADAETAKIIKYLFV